MLLKLVDQINRLFIAKSFDERMLIMEEIIAYVNSYTLSGGSMDNPFRSLLTAKINLYATNPSTINKKDVLLIIAALKMGNNVSGI